jgi:small conductance mechanosensitive channel
MDDRTVKVIVTAALWLSVVVVVRWALNRAYGGYERRLAQRDPADAARRRTTFDLLRRVIVAIVIGIGAWSVLSIYPQTTELAHAMLASSAVLALFAGLAFSTPLSNLGSGLLVAFRQPLRLGDRVTIGEHTGFVEEISLLYTTLSTDDDRRVFIPNSQLTGNPIVNRTIRDPRRAVTASFPVRLGAPVADAVATVRDAARGVGGTLGDDVRVVVGDVSQSGVVLTATVFAPLGADVGAMGSDLRAEVLGALAREGLLPLIA